MTKRTVDNLICVLPVFNEAESIVPIVQAIRHHTEKYGVSLKLLFIDDGSTDTTWQEIARAAKEEGNVQGLRLSRNFGKEHAVAAGLENCPGHSVLVMDADFQHPPEVLPQLIDAWLSNKGDIVEAIKSRRGQESVSYGFFAKLYYALLRSLAGFDLSNSSDFKLIDERVIMAWRDMKERVLFIRGMLAWAGFSTQKIYFEVAERRSGSTKQPILRLCMLALNSLTSFSSLPLRIPLITGVIFIVFALVVALTITWLKFSGHTISGTTTIAFLILITGGIILVNLAIVAQYIAKIYDETKQRPRYLIAERIEHNCGEECQ